MTDEPLRVNPSTSAAGRKTEVERLKEMKLRWESRYQKLKYLLRGCFYGTATDWAKFFDEKRPGRGAPGKNGDAAAVAPQPVAVAS
jgi:hypothetical protein